MNELNAPATLVDLLTVFVDRNLPVDEKTADYVRQIQDPYHYKVGNVKITALFDNTAPALAKGYTKLRA
jgi:hypothetical protein